MATRTGNLDRCIREAEQFYDVAIYCRVQNQHSPFYFLFPLFVNAAFSCELYLKAIAMIESGNATFIDGHKLDVLYNNISVTAQQKIRGNYNNKGIYITLDEILSKYNNNFAEWRYSFENGSEGNRIGIIGLAESLKEYVDTIK